MMDDRISMLEDRITALEKLLKLVTLPDKNAILSELLNDAPRIYSFDFTSEKSDFSQWRLINADEISRKGKLVYKAVPFSKPYRKVYDPILANETVRLEAEKAKYIQVNIKCTAADNRPEHYIQIYFKTESDNEYSESKKIKIPCKCNTEQEITAELFSNKFWQGTITGIRLDLLEIDGIMEIKNLKVTSIPPSQSNSEDIVFSTEFKNRKTLDESGWKVINGEILDTDNKLLYKAVLSTQYRLCSDPVLVNDNIKADISNVRYVHLRCKGIPESNWNVYAQIYFKTIENNEYSQNKSVGMQYEKNKTVDLYIDMRVNNHWRGTLTGLRADIMETSGTMEIECIELIYDTPAASIGGWILYVENRLSENQCICDNIDDFECRIDDAECRIDELESRIDDLESQIEE